MSKRKQKRVDDLRGLLNSLDDCNREYSRLTAYERTLEVVEAQAGIKKAREVIRVMFLNAEDEMRNPQ